MRLLRAIELHAHFREIGNWVDWDDTCDEFLAGDACAEVRGIAVSWMPTFRNLESALASGCNLFVTHEPLYVSDGDSGGLIGSEGAWVRKKAWLEETGMVVYRCHDFWDDYPEDGIHGAWARWLGFEGEPLARRRFYEVHAVDALSLGELAEGILERVRPLGQEVVHVIGDLEMSVSRVALGTGAITGYRQMYNMGADVLLLTDDGTRLWESGQWSLDSSVPLIILNHSTSEEPGMITLARYIRETFPDVPVEHIPVGCLYQTIPR